MKSIYFSNKKSLQIISNDIKNDIKQYINKIGSFNLTSKYYTFLNKKNVNNLKENNFLISLSTFGKKFILFITIYNNKKYCIFINKKNDSMIVTQLKFADDIFLGTLFDGELVKNSNEKWIYLINDIAYYKGNNIITKTFEERQNIINNIIMYEHQNGDNDSETLFITKKIYFENKNIKDLVDNYINHLNYKCSGLYFKNTNNFSNNYLFIFPECRSDSKILGGTNIEIETNNLENKQEYKPESKPESKQEYKQDFKQESKPKNLKLEKTTCRFLLNNTPMPDIYELYCINSNNSIEKHSYASVPDLHTSDFLKKLTENNMDIMEDIKTRLENNKVIFVECNYHKGFKKWIPFKKVDSMDSINTINHIQIILDSL
jgi:hypothetical protein